MSNVDFTAARHKHLQWSTRLRSFLDGASSLTTDQAVSHKHCDLGLWIYSAGKQLYGNHPIFIKLEKLHEEMHGHVGKVIENSHSGKIEAAEQGYQNVVDLSGEIILCLNQLEWVHTHRKLSGISRWIRNISVKVKIHALSVAALLLALLLGGLGILSIITLQKQNNEILRLSPEVDAAMEMKIAITNEQLVTMEMIAATGQADLEETWSSHHSWISHYQTFSNALISGGETKEGKIYATKNLQIRELLTTVGESYQQNLQPMMTKIYQLQREAILNQVEVEQENINHLDSQFDSMAVNLISQLGKIEDLARIDMERVHIQMENRGETNLFIIGITLLVGIVITLILNITISRSINRSVTNAITLTEKITQGDLVTEVLIEQNDEMGQLLMLLNNMRERLQTTVKGIRESAESVSSSSKEIAAGNLDLSHRTENLAISLETAVSNMGEQTETVKKSSENSGFASQLTIEALAVSTTGAAVVEQAIAAMNKISESSRKIAQIIGVVDEIAFQTNLLALNAAVEAARAGEQGRGFAVVAAEVRNLAQRSANSAKDIKGLISDSLEKVDEGNQLVNQSGETFKILGEKVKRASEIVTDIAVANRQQSEALIQLNQSVSAMDQVTQQNAAMVEEISSAANSLSDETRMLVGMMSYFKT